MAAACPAWAAEPAATQVSEIVVTGTRLPNPDLTADSPIRTVTAEQVAQRGAMTLETVLNRLPQVTPSYSSAANNPSKNGVAYVDLRGLGPSRNLVLLDGRRVIGADASNSVDLNTIPMALIDRIEVVTGGASAVYGADAVAGVVNVILKHRYDGLELDTKAQVSQRGDGEEFSATATGGRTFSRGSLMGSFGWSERNPIGKGARPFSRYADQPSSAIPSGGYIVSGANAPSQSAINTVFGRYGVAPGAVGRNGGVAGFSFNSDGTLFATGRPSDPAFDVQNFRGSASDYVPALYPDVYGYNYQPFNKLILPLQRWSGALFGEADATDHVTLYGQATATRYSASTALAPTPALMTPNPLYPGQAVNGFTIPVTNPFIPADLAQLLASRTGDTPALAGRGAGEEFLYRFRATTLGPRQSTNHTATVNLVGGARAELGGDWRADAYVSYGRYTREELQDGLLSVRAVEQLLDSPTGGKDLCAGGFNPFGGILSDACKSFVRVRTSFSTTISQTNAVASASGTVLTLPAGPVRLAVGLEYRAEQYDFRIPAGVNSNEVAGFNAQIPLSGGVLFRDAFGELAVPLLADAPGAERVDLTLGYRLSDERTSGTANAYKAELGWTVVPAVRLRFAAQRAVRAPNIFERYTPSGDSPGSLAIDPCAIQAHPAGQVLALCQKQAAAGGFSPAFLADFSQDDPSVGERPHGNPDVQPERATTYTAGVVLKPAWRSAWVSDVTATIDGYAIRIDGAIGFADPQIVLNACYNIGGATNPTYDPQNPNCLKFSRSGIDFQVFDLDEPETNQARVETGGVDAALTFRTDLAELGSRSWLGRLDTRLTASWLGYFRRQASPLAATYDFAGTIAGAFTGYATLPRWKAEGDVTWTSGPAQLTLAGRYIGSMTHADLKIDPTEAATGVGSAWYWDLLGAWTLGRAELRAGVLNLLDRSPNLYFPAVDASTEPSTYDVIGRRFWLGLTLRY